MSDAHQTSGTRLRDGHAADGQLLRYTIDRERDELLASAGHTSGGRAAKTLAKSDTLRVTLVRLLGGTTVHPSATAGAASLQVIEGRISIGDMQSAGSEATAGELLVFPNNLRDTLRAVEDSTILITIAWEEGAGAWDQEEQEGRH